MNFIFIAVFSITIFLIFQSSIYFRIRRRISNRKALKLLDMLFGVLIFFLNFPLLFNFLFYKFYHPQFVDNLFLKILPIFISLHLSVFILGGAFIIWDKFILKNKITLSWWVKLKLYMREKIRKTIGSSVEKNIFTNKEIKKNEFEKSELKKNEFEKASNRRIDNKIIDNKITNNKSENNTILKSELNRRAFIKTGGVALGVGLISNTTVNAMQTTYDYIVEHKRFKIPNLPNEFKGLKIGMITDIHSSVFMPKSRMKQYVQEVNNLKPDIIFVTGDFVNSKLSEVYPFAECFVDLKAPMGVFGVTGNHDYYTREIETVCKEVEQCGIKLIRNSNITLEKNNQKIHLLGIDDDYSKTVREYISNGKTELGAVENMLKGVSKEDTSILLCHKPYYFDEYAKLNIDLVLSGHTHGGQMVFGKIDNVPLSFAAIVSKYVAGGYRTKENPESLLYVNRGLAAVGIPVRFNCPGEITLITLG